ncbi:unnamed protein product, partial [Didymodactylos carnosus]
SVHSLENDGLNSLENDGLVQTAIEIGANFGLVDVRDFEERKTGLNVWKEIEEIFESFNLLLGDTPVTTDQGSNMINALKINHEARYACLAHRTSTVLETAWENLKTVSDIRTYVQQSGGLQHKLPKTLKRTSGTRPWRSYYLIHQSLYEAYDTLFQLLRECREQHHLTHIDQKITYEISELVSEFSAIFDNLEFSKKTTLQNVIPSYYLMKQYCIVDNKHDKYWTSTVSLHWIATYLDPSFKESSFVNDRKFLDDQKQCIIGGLLVLTKDFKDFLTPATTTDSSPSSSLSSTATTVATTTFVHPLKKIKKD